MNITVLGAGVQGLSVAVLLQHQGHNVTIVAKGSPDDWNPELKTKKATPADATYTSPKAGANWQSFADADDVRQQAYIYYDDMPSNFVEPWFSRITPGYSHIPVDQLPPGRRFGYTYETVTVNVPKYLTWLLAKFRAGGGDLIHKEVTYLEDVLKVVKKTDVLVNCTGFGARTLGPLFDYDVYPTRGQTVLVRAPQVTRTISTAGASTPYRPNSSATSEEDSKVTYIIPREDGIVVLGGTYQANNPDLEPDPKTAQGIIERCVQVCPELVVNGKLPEIVQHSVGLRPTRKNGVRLDAQYQKTPSGKEILLIHNYGHGGYGYQSSWGCASNVVAIVRRAIGVPVDDKILTNFLESVFRLVRHENYDLCETVDIIKWLQSYDDDPIESDREGRVQLNSSTELFLTRINNIGGIEKTSSTESVSKTRSVKGKMGSEQQQQQQQKSNNQQRYAQYTVRESGKRSHVLASVGNSNIPYPQHAKRYIEGDKGMVKRFMDTNKIQVWQYFKIII
ncbi:hypothetical protein HDU76_011570 [Blyttiomyces sp. JEL0837]|nr:hypothetical protein HDU76_011570 [Blyttiomyces sp. JEL0837]